MSLIDTLLSQLNSEQTKAVVNTIHKDTLLLAGPGSGKTRVLQTRYLYLVKKHNIDPYNILAFTFTNKAANELKSRIRSGLTEHELNSATIGTFHGICVRLMHNYNKLLGIDNFTITDTNDTKRTIRYILDDMMIEADKNRLNSFISSISEYKSKLISTDEAFALSTNSATREVAIVYQKYQEYLKHHNLMDFDDLVSTIVKALQNNLEFRNRINSRYKYIMVDEVQDTDEGQHKLIQYLGTNNNIFMVGDIDQSLYSWRGARPEYFNNFLEHYPNGQILELSNNYRSTKTIIKAADSVIANNIMRFPKQMQTNNIIGEPITITNNKDAYTEAYSVAMNIRKLKITNNYNWRDFAVLYRTNSQSRVLEEQFLKAGIPYELIGSVSFYERKEIKDIVSYLRLIVNEHDDPAMIRVLELQPGIGKTTVHKAMDIAKNNTSSIYDVVLNNKMANTRKNDISFFVYAFNDFLQTIRDPSTNWEINEIIDLIFTRFYDATFDKKDKAYESRLDNITELKNLAIDYKTKTDTPTISGFIETLVLRSDQDDIEEKDNIVKLMTGHASKGLEFPVVFIVNAEEKIIPHEKCMADTKQLEEERRIFFVMMTRAQERLYISHSASRRDRDGSLSQQVVSRFVREIPMNLKINKLNYN